MFWCVKQKDYLCIRKTESNNSIIKIENCLPVKRNALVAQLVEHLTLNQRVQGSNPCRRTKKRKQLFMLLSFLFIP